MNLILSCRNHDVLMLPEVIKLCQKTEEFRSKSSLRVRVMRGLQSCTVLLTGTMTDGAMEDSPFSDHVTSIDDELDKLQNLSNAQVFAAG